jgi:hypothetical protein
MSSLAEQHLDDPRLVHGALTYDSSTDTSHSRPRRSSGSHDSAPIVVSRVRRKRQRLGPNGCIESDSALHVRRRGVRPRAVSLPIESYRYSGPNGGAGEYAKPKRLSGWQGPELFVQQSKSLFLQ